jgi:hypothetical protein
MDHSLIGIRKPVFRGGLVFLALYTLASLVWVSVTAKHPLGILPRARLTVVKAEALLDAAGEPAVSLVVRPEQSPFYGADRFELSLSYQKGDRTTTPSFSWKELSLLDDDPQTTPASPVPVGRALTFRIPLERTDNQPIAMRRVGNYVVWGYKDLWQDLGFPGGID